METVEVQVNSDHLEKLAKSCSPLAAIIELIWNSLDADSKIVRVIFSKNDLDSIDRIKIVDDGHGLAIGEARKAFQNLGGSHKRLKSKTIDGRILHGREGKGRFRAFRLGNQVSWETRYQDDGVVRRYHIEGNRSNLKRFGIDETESTQDPPGTTVLVTEIVEALPNLESSKNIQKITEEFAFYLRQYNDVSIYYCGHLIQPSEIEEHIAEYKINAQISEDRNIEIDLTIIEWLINAERAIYLCDRDGFTLDKINAGIRAPGFMFTAYLKSDFIRELNEDGLLQMAELSTDLKSILDSVRDKMREHCRLRAASQVVDLVQQWKDEEVYPYVGEPASVIEKAERQIFDVVALNVNEYLPDFEDSSAANKKLQFQLLRTAIETSPESVQSIVRDVLKLPTEKQEEFAELLERTSLEAMINASKIVADRLDFLQGLELLVIDPEGKKRTLERRQLHKIVADHTWIFGEEFNLTVSDRSLTNVLRRILAESNREILDDSPVVREDGSEGIIDLMLSKVIPQPQPDKRHHLIIELKRPKRLFIK